MPAVNFIVHLKPDTHNTILERLQEGCVYAWNGIGMSVGRNFLSPLFTFPYGGSLIRGTLLASLCPLLYSRQ